MASKMVIARQKSAEAVAALGTAQSEMLARALVHKLGGLEEQKVKAMLERFAAGILQARSEMVSKDEAHETELSDDPAARDARDTAARNLRSQLIELRQVVTGLYGDTIARRVFTEATPIDPVTLSRFAAEVCARLQEIDLGQPRVAGAQMDKAALIQQLTAQRNELASCLEAVAVEEREAQVTMVAKHKAIASYDQTFTGLATVFEGLFILAGERELAARVRPSLRRPGQTSQEVNELVTEAPILTEVE